MPETPLIIARSPLTSAVLERPWNDRGTQKGTGKVKKKKSERIKIKKKRVNKKPGWNWNGWRIFECLSGVAFHADRLCVPVCSSVCSSVCVCEGGGVHRLPYGHLGRWRSVFFLPFFFKEKKGNEIREPPGLRHPLKNPWHPSTMLLLLGTMEREDFFDDPRIISSQIQKKKKNGGDCESDIL